ncbi:MAG: hypothetical protein JWO03_990 [Bacteroidetes bacterium]|nr:hypothetical protein [Bacteroidota bacterium]
MKAIQLITLIVFVLIVSSIHAQTPGWSWARGNTGAGIEAWGQSVCTDAMGNIYVTGSYKGRNIILGNDTLINTDSTRVDTYIAKYDASGNVLWAINAGGMRDDYTTGIACAPNGDIVVTGWYESDHISFGGVTLYNSFVGRGDIFVARLGASGNTIWAKSAGNTREDIAFGIATYLSGNAYIAGRFESPTITFGSSVLTNDSNYYSKSFLVKYDASGNALWGRSGKGQYANEATGIATDAAGYIYITGDYSGQELVLEGDTLSNIYSIANSPTIYLAKYDNSGNVLWGTTAGGTNQNLATGITTDRFGHIYVTGIFMKGTIYIDGNAATNPGNPSYNIDGFIAQFDENGYGQWIRDIGGNRDENAGSLSVDETGGIYVTGTFNDSILVYGTDTLRQNRGTGVLLIKYNSIGNIVWAKGASSRVAAGFNIGYGVCTDHQGNVYLVGEGAYGTAFDQDTIGETAGHGYAFIAKVHAFIATSVEETGIRSGIVLYPNPSTGVFYFAGMKEGEMIEVYDVMGRNTLLIRREDAGNSVVNLSGKAKGVYFYRITDAGNLVQQGKMVVE